MKIIYEPYSYDEILDNLNEDGTVEALVEVDREFYEQLVEAEEQNDDECDVLYDQLAAMVIGDQWCYFGLSWEHTTEEPLDARENIVLKVAVTPDLS